MKKISNKKTNKKISIPYGAIKRMSNFIYKNYKKKFQFLMVRLKDSAFQNSLFNGEDFNSLWCD